MQLLPPWFDTYSQASNMTQGALSPVYLVASLVQHAQDEHNSAAFGPCHASKSQVKSLKGFSGDDGGLQTPPQVVTCCTLLLCLFSYRHICGCWIYLDTRGCACFSYLAEVHISKPQACNTAAPAATTAAAAPTAAAAAKCATALDAS